MIECRKIRTELSAYLDGELTSAEQARVEVHLSECASCRQRLAELRRLEEGITRLPQLEPPPRFVAEVRQKIRARTDERTWVDVMFRPLWLKLPVEVVAVVAVAMSILFAVHRPAEHLPEKETLYTAAIETQPQPPPVPVASLRKQADGLARAEGALELQPMAAAKAMVAPEPAAPPVAEKAAAELAATAAAAVAPPVTRSAPAPTATKAKEVRASARTAGALLSEAPTADAKAFNSSAQQTTADKAAGPEVVVLANANPTWVEQQVTALVKEMQGALLEVKRDNGIARSIRVRVPTAMVAEFKTQLAETKTGTERQLRRQVIVGYAAGPEEQAKREAEGADAVRKMPMTELEIRIVSPAKK